MLIIVDSIPLKDYNNTISNHSLKGVIVMFSAIAKTEDKFIVDQNHLVNLNKQEKKSYLNCVSMLNGMSFFEIMLFSTFVKMKNNISDFFKK